MRLPSRAVLSPVASPVLQQHLLPVANRLRGLQADSASRAPASNKFALRDELVIGLLCRVGRVGIPREAIACPTRVQRSLIQLHRERRRVCSEGWASPAHQAAVGRRVEGIELALGHLVNHVGSSALPCVGNVPSIRSEQVRGEDDTGNRMRGCHCVATRVHGTAAQR